jgi:TrmH family RNA methyltransferase
MSSIELTSTRSPRVNAARRLIKRAFRDRDGRFLAEGPQACREAAAAPGALLELYVTAEAATRHPEIVEAGGAPRAAVGRAAGPPRGGRGAPPPPGPRSSARPARSSRRCRAP